MRSKFAGELGIVSHCAGGLMKHKCKPAAICICYSLATEPNEKCPVHGYDPYTRCICGRFVKESPPIRAGKRSKGQGMANISLHLTSLVRLIKIETQAPLSIIYAMAVLAFLAGLSVGGIMWAHS